MIRTATLMLALAACGGPPRPAGPPPDYPGHLVASEALHAPAGLGEAFAIEQRVRSESPAGDPREFRAILQLDGGVLTMVGLGPHGGRAFVLTLRGTEVEFESNLPEELPFPPEFMLHDAQRAWFRGLDGPLPDGEHVGMVEGEEVTERWEGGRLHERVFRREDRPDEELRVTYEGGLGPDAAPERLVLDNGWFGYRLILTTLSHERFDPAAAAPSEPSSGGDRPAPEPPG